MYQITPEQYQKAKQLGVQIFPSDRPAKKIKVVTKSKILYIGDSKYSDYSQYIASHGLQYANERRRLYRIRHEKDMNVLGTPGYYSLRILWN